MNKIPARQLSAWLFAAITPPLVQLACGASWAWLGILGCFCLILGRAVRHCGAEVPCLLCWPGFVLLVLVAGELARAGGEGWPMGGSHPAVSLSLLALATWSASKGADAAARVGGVLFWFTIIMYAFVGVAGVSKIEPAWLAPTGRAPDGLCAVLLLLPAGAMCLPVVGKGVFGKAALALAVTLGAMIFAQGILSPAVAGEAAQPFYEMGRSLEFLGVAQRFEALICTAAVTGWFCALALVLSIAGELVRRVIPGGRNWGIWIGAVLSAIWSFGEVKINGWILAVLAGILWVLIPICSEKKKDSKKSKKIEKSA